MMQKLLLIQMNNFNSIKVQLERNTEFLPHQFKKFQFHKGTIRTFLAQVLQVLCVQHFNSIKVQLELRWVLFISSTLTTFQFHKGTIRTTWMLREKRIGHQFQFHKGTIRTLVTHDFVIPSSYFNSIKVQLEQ